jgi:hypothetical protein
MCMCFLSEWVICTVWLIGKVFWYFITFPFFHGMLLWPAWLGLMKVCRLVDLIFRLKNVVPLYGAVACAWSCKHMVHFLLQAAAACHFAQWLTYVGQENSVLSHTSLYVSFVHLFLYLLFFISDLNIL